jgi:sugar (pentulose or hexulose) kinase
MRSMCLRCLPCAPRLSPVSPPEPGSAPGSHRESNPFRPQGAPTDKLTATHIYNVGGTHIYNAGYQSHGHMGGGGRIGGIGVAGQMHGILYVDGDGRAVSPLFTWQDGRGDQELEGTTYAGMLSEALGRPVSTGMGFVTHYYNVKNGLVPRGAACLCTIADYVAMRLAHAQAPVMDATNAASLGCIDLRRLEFRRDAMSALDIDGAIFPRVSTSCPALGEARNGTPVFAALGDNQASFLGSVRDVRGSLLCNIGTGSQISLFSDDCLDVPGIDTRPFPLGGYIGVGAALCGGGRHTRFSTISFSAHCGFSAAGAAAARRPRARPMTS